MESRKLISNVQSPKSSDTEYFGNDCRLTKTRSVMNTSKISQEKPRKMSGESSFLEVKVLENYDDDDEPLEQKSGLSAMKYPTWGKAKATVETDDEVFSVSLKSQHEAFQLNSVSTVIQPVMFTIKSEELKDRKRLPFDLVCVIDTSEYMKGEKIKLLKESLKLLSDLLEENDRVSIVQFNTEGQRILSLKRVSKRNKKEIITAIDSLYAEGGSNIAKGMKIAYRILNERKQRNPISSIFLLSGGEDSEAIINIRNLIKTRGLNESATIYSFGYGSGHDSKLMTAIANINGGNFYFIEKLETVSECFADAIGGLTSVVGQKVNIAIEMVSSEIFPMLDIKKAYGGAVVWQTDGRTYRTRIGQLMSGRSKNYVFELAIPRKKEEITDAQREVVLVKAYVTVEIPGSKAVWEKQCELKLTLFNKKETLPMQIANKEVLTSYYRVRTAEILILVRKVAEKEEKDYERARRILQNFRDELVRTELRNEPIMSGLLEDIQTAMLEMQPMLYVSGGKSWLVQQITSNMEERSNPFSSNSANLYSNSTQREMVKYARLSKH